jgi:hypothetical protein
MIRRRSILGRRLAALAVMAACTGLFAACILGEPTGDLPTLPPMRPTIVRGSVVPSPQSVLGSWPASFLVPVELADPTVKFDWAAFVDYNARTDEGLALPGTSTFEASNVASHVRVLEIPIPQPTDGDRCHVVEVVVALALESLDNPTTAHTPRPPGGDSVTWFYNPTGDLAGCPVLDAGLDASRIEDGGDGGIP